MILSGSSPQDTRNANDRWKERWRARLYLSMAGALIAHFALFAIWPDWERVRVQRERLSELVQLTPILAPGGSDDEGLRMAEIAPETEDAELSAPDQGSSIQEAPTPGEGFDELLYAMRDPIPRTVNPVVGGLDGRGGGLQLDELNLDRLSVLTPRVSLLPPTVAWPLIRNPGVVERALRSYARSRIEAGGGSLVSVMVGINERGSVEWAEVQESSGQMGIDQFAVSIFNDVVIFAPARSAGAPIPVQIIVSILF